MNIKKGLLRLTLVISIFVGMTTLFLNELFLPRHSITIKIPNPMKLTEDRRQQLDGIVQEMVENKETDKNIQAVVDDFKNKYGHQPPKGKGESKTIDYLVNNSEFKKLSKIEQLNIKGQFMGDIPEIQGLDEFGKHTLRIEYTFKPGWRELSLLALVGFASPWIIYLFIRWVIVAFIIEGFRHKAKS